MNAYPASFIPGRSQRAPLHCGCGAGLILTASDSRGAYYDCPEHRDLGRGQLYSVADVNTSSSYGARSRGHDRYGESFGDDD